MRGREREWVQSLSIFCVCMCVEGGYLWWGGTSLSVSHNNTAVYTALQKWIRRKPSWTPGYLSHHSSSLQSCGMYSKTPYNKSSLLIDFYIKSRLKRGVHGFCCALVLTSSWRVSFRQINPMGQHKVNPSNILNWILLCILVRDSPQY